MIDRERGASPWPAAVVEPNGYLQVDFIHNYLLLSLLQLSVSLFMMFGLCHPRFACIYLISPVLGYQID